MDFSNLTNYLENIDHNFIPDCEIVVYKDHQCLYKNTFSKPNYNPEESQKDMYYLFSATKVITATATLRLVEEGKLDLDDPVCKFLPEFADLYVKNGSDILPAKNALTIRHLFSMQGGFTYNFFAPSIQEAIKKYGSLGTTREIVSSFTTVPLIFEPGENFCYSLCHDILAAVVEVVVGKRFSEYINEVIFTPLGMKDSTFRSSDEVMNRMKQQFRVDPVTKIAVPQKAECAYDFTQNYDSGGAGIISTLNDYSKFVDALACGESENGYRLLKPETVELMKTNQLTENSLKTFRTAVQQGQGYGYGLGVRTMMEPELDSSLSPVGEFGWDGAAGAYCLIDTEKHLSVFYAQHVLNCKYVYVDVHKAIRNLVYKALDD